MEPHHAPRHARKRGGRWLLPALVGSACAVFLLCLLPHLMPTASASGQPAASPAPVESAPDSGTPGISVNWEPSPSPAPEEQEEAPWYLRLVNLENRLPQDFTVELPRWTAASLTALGRPKPSPGCWRTWRPRGSRHGVLLLPHLGGPGDAAPE